MTGAVKHAPGPWHLGYPPEGGVTGPTASPLVWWDCTQVRSQIITVGSDVVAIVAKDGGLDDEQHANARLIAAAPELLEACEEALGALNGAEHALPGYVVAALERAIAKATVTVPRYPADDDWQNPNAGTRVDLCVVDDFGRLVRVQ